MKKLTHLKKISFRIIITSMILSSAIALLGTAHTYAAQQPHLLGGGDFNEKKPTPEPVEDSSMQAEHLNADTVDIEIRGSGVFVSQARAALNLLSSCDQQALSIVDKYISKVQEYNRSGMEVVSDTFLASNTTAFAPTFTREAQIFWFAGTIVHDAHHSWQSDQGVNTDWGSLSFTERETLEADARVVQIDTLKLCLPSLSASARPQAEYMLSYLEGMQNSAVDCEYCQVEWGERGW